MLRRSLAACAGLAFLQTQAIAGTQFIGTIAMYVCDGGEDLCSNTLTSSPVELPAGPFTEAFVFDFVNNFHHYPDDIPFFQAIVRLQTDNEADFIPGNVQLYDSSGTPFGFEIIPFRFDGSGYNARNGAAIYPGVGQYVEVTGVTSADALPLQVSISAFDLGPIFVPEPSTWAMMLLGMAGLGFVAWQRTTRTLAIGKKASLSN